MWTLPKQLPKHSRADDIADVTLADRIAALIGADRGAVLYELRYGEPGMRSLAKANRARQRDDDAEDDDENGDERRDDEDDEDDENLRAAERERIAAADHARRNEEYRGLELRRRKASTMTSRSSELRSIVKEAGSVTALCKRIVKANSSAGISEHELTSLITAYATAAQPELTEAAAFTKMFESPAGEPLRRAVAIAKAGAMAYPHPFPRV